MFPAPSNNNRLNKSRSHRRHASVPTRPRNGPDTVQTRKNTVSHGCRWFRCVPRARFIMICSFRRALHEPGDEQRFTKHGLHDRSKHGKTRLVTVVVGFVLFPGFLFFVLHCSEDNRSNPNDECKESHIDFRVDSKRAQPRSPRLKFISFWFRSSCCQTAQKTQPRHPGASPNRLSPSSHRSISPSITLVIIVIIIEHQLVVEFVWAPTVPGFRRNKKTARNNSETQANVFSNFQDFLQPFRLKRENPLKLK